MEWNEVFNKIKAMDNEIKRNEDIIIQHTGMIDVLEIELKNTQVERDKLVNQKKVLRSRVKNQKSTIKYLSKELADTNEKYHLTIDENVTLITKNNELKLELDKLKSHINALTMKIKDHRNEIEGLKEIVSDQAKLVSDYANQMSFMTKPQK